MHNISSSTKGAGNYQVYSNLPPEYTPSGQVTYEPSRRIDPGTPPAWMRPRPWYEACIPWLVFFILVFLGVAIFLAIYLGIPRRTNILLLGIDYTEPGSSLARTDSIVLATYSPLKPYVGLLSIPRDLWVNIPGYGENRINTAHFFAEAQSPGSGPQATIEMIEQDFNVNVDYFIRFKFDGFREIIDALGGLDLTLNKPAAGYEPGSYHLTGKKALAFVRSRYGSDDFFRMENGQIVLRAVLVQLLKPKSWIRYPSVLNAIRKSVTTNLPVFQWPRLVIALLRAGPDGIDNRTVSREMTTPYTTDQGASVLLPVWPVIHMVVQDMFK